MPEQTGDLFPAAASTSRGKTDAPEQLAPPQIRAMHAWAEKTVPWVSRGAFDSMTTLEQHVEECLEWWQGEGRRKKRWVQTIQNRIRTVERRRLERLARSGNEEARLALRQPEEWARRYDRKVRAVEAVSNTQGGEGLLRPTGGTVISITPPSRS